MRPDLVRLLDCGYTAPDGGIGSSDHRHHGRAAPLTTNSTNPKERPRGGVAPQGRDEGIVYAWRIPRWVSARKMTRRMAAPTNATTTSTRMLVTATWASPA